MTAFTAGASHRSQAEIDRQHEHVLPVGPFPVSNGTSPPTHSQCSREALRARLSEIRGDLNLARPHAEVAYHHTLRPYQPIGVPHARRAHGHHETMVGNFTLVPDHVQTAMCLSLCDARYEITLCRHLQSIFNKLGLSSRAAVTACAYERSLIEPTSR